MAKYQLKNIDRKVSCELLTESDGQYVVRFTNGIVQRVPKDRISDLDKIDEGVLDTIRRVGGKLSDKIKGAAHAVKDFFVKVFGGYVFFTDENDNVANASHPINSMIAAQSLDCVNFIPSTDTVELCDEVGVNPVAVVNFDFAGGNEYEGAIDFGAVSESCQTSDDPMDALFETERLKDSEKIQLKGEFADWNEDMIVEHIANEYEARRGGKKPASLPLMIWGAPGIGKTAIIRSLKEMIKEKTGEDINILSVNGGNVGPDDFTMPAQISRTLKRDSDENIDAAGFKGGSSETIKDLPKSWLPVYDVNSEDSDDLRKIANGAKVVDGEVKSDGPGGIFFIDEFSRMTPAGINALMQTPTTREIGSNSTLTFGDRWVIVCAANRKSDMSRNLRSEALEFEGASKTRFNHCNFVPTPEKWLKWASSESKRRPGRKNIISEIISYIENEIRKGKASNTFGDFYEMYVHPKGDLDGTKGTACPRTWEAYSEDIIDQCLDNTYGQKYPDVISIPKAKLVEIGAGIVGKDVADRFADFVASFSSFTAKDAKNVWTKGDNVQYEIIKKQKLNSANIEDTFKKQIFPMLKDNYPGGITGPISSDAALNFVKFLESCCYESGKFNLNRFNTICQEFSQMFNVDLRSLDGPYADVANYKENVVAQNERI